jgi:hypothetical protein
MTDAELVCIAVAQVLLRCDEERYWLRAAPKLVGHLLARLLATEMLRVCASLPEVGEVLRHRSLLSTSVIAVRPWRSARAGDKGFIGSARWAARRAGVRAC